MDNFSVLPEGCISQILSMTSPLDACRSSAISSGFDAAANSDSVWEKFLPSDYRQITSRSVSPVVFSTKKQLINTAMLSANTTYAAYLIFKMADHYGFESLPVKSSVRFVKELDEGYQDDMSCTVYLTLGTVRSLRREQNGRLPQRRRDGWMEIELGEFYNDRR
ncbi:hypothetical protein C3L33_17420, partial [Rhododendron williamsianum]